MLALLFGVAWLLGAVHALHVPIEGVLALGLMLLGAAMVVTGRTDWSLSRRSWPIWLGVGLVIALFATSSAFGLGSGASDLSFGNRSVALDAASSHTVHGGFGNLTVNASKLQGGDSLEVASVAGRVAVQLPPGTAVSVDARLVAGQICVDGADVADGPHAQYHSTTNGTGPPVNLDVHEVFGQIQIGALGCRHR